MPKYGDTPDHSTESLCLTCLRGTVIQGFSESQRLVICHAIGEGTPVPFEVRSCGTYEHKLEVSLYDMEKIAHILTHKDGKFIGFVPPKRKGDND